MPHQSFIEYFTYQFEEECLHICRVFHERNPRRSNFTDILLQVIGLGSHIPTTDPASLAVKYSTTGINKIGTLGYDYYEVHKLEKLVNQIIPVIKHLKSLAKSTAHSAAYQYEYAITQLIDKEHLPTFAYCGVKRMFEYIIREQLPFTPQNLLTGLVKGKTGAGIEGLFNTSLDGQQTEQKFHAEDLYGRAAYRTSDGRFWANVDRINTEIRQRTERFAQRMIGEPLDSHFGWVKIDDQNMPLCGYRWASYEEVKELEYEVFTVYPQSNFAQKLTVYQPNMRIADATDIASYMRARRKGYYYNFNQYIGAVARFKGVLSNFDLSFGDFSHTDFSDTIFIDCKLDHAYFSNTQMQHCQLLGTTTAINIKLKAAQCAYLQASEISFVRADLDGADFYKANFQGADIRQTTRVDSHWEEANDTRLRKGGVYHEEDTDHFNPHTHESAPIFTALKNKTTDANLIQQWLGAYLSPTLTKHLGSATAPFALLGVGDIAFINGRAQSHLQCVLITSQNNTDEQQEQVAKIAPSIKKSLQAAMVILKSIDITIELTFYKKNDSPPAVLQKLRWQQGFLLGGNIELYTQYIQMLRREKIDIHQALTSHIRESNDPQNTIYYLASFYKIEWAPINELLAHFSQRRLIHPQLAEDLTFCLTAQGVWHESFDGIRTIWYDIIREATETTTLQLFSYHPAERLDTLNNRQHYFTYFSFRLQQAPDETARQLVLQAWQIQYQKLTQEQQLQWMEQLEQHSTQNPTIKNTLFNHLLMINRPNGWHYNLIYHRKQWLNNWQSLLAPDANNQVTLRIPSVSQSEPIQTRTLSSEVTQMFLDERGHFTASHSTQSSMHPIYRIEHQGHTFWGKPIAEQPAIEYAVVELMKHIVGQTFLPETLITACHIPGREPIAIQWSEHMPGKPLESLEAKNTWENNPLQNLSDESFLAHLFRVIITGPEDDSGKHLHLAQGENGKVDLFGVDLDRGFLTPNDSGFLGFNKILQVKSMILCFNQMQQPIDLKNPMIQRFMRLDAHALLENWLESLVAKHKTYEDLFNDASFTTHFMSPLSLFTQEEIRNLMPNTKPSVSILTLHLGKELLIELNKRIGLMQSVLKRHWHENTPITGLELLTEVHPELGVNYQSIFTDVTHNEQGFKGLSSDIVARAEAVFLKPIAQLPKHLLPLLRFWERTRKVYTYVLQKGQQQTTQAAATAVSASLRLNNPLTLTQAKEIRKGRFMSPHQAKEVLQTLQSQRGYEIIARLKSDAKLSKEEEELLIATFHLLSARQKKSLLKAEIDKVNKDKNASTQWQERLLSLIPGTPLHDLDLSGFAETLTDEKLYAILAADSAGKHVKSLSLNGCKKITDKAIHYIAENCLRIITLNLDDTHVTAIKPGYFANEEQLSFPYLQSLSANNCLQLLAININAPSCIKLMAYDCSELDKLIISGSLKRIEMKLDGCKRLKENRDENYEVCAHVESIVKGLASGGLIEISFSSSQNVCDADFSRIMIALNENNKITRMTWKNYLTDEHVIAISSYLIKNSSVKKIDFSDNKISSIGALYLSKVLEENITIEELNLNNNHIGDDGAKAIFQVLRQKNRTLEKIYIDNTSIGNAETATAISDVIIDNNFIKVISFLAVHISEIQVQALIRSLAINKIVHLTLSSNNEALMYLSREDRTYIPTTDPNILINWARDQIRNKRLKESPVYKFKKEVVQRPPSPRNKHLEYIVYSNKFTGIA